MVSTEDRDTTVVEFPMTTNLKGMMDGMKHVEAGYTMTRPHKIYRYREADYAIRDDTIFKNSTFTELAEATGKPDNAQVNSPPYHVYL